MSQGTVIPKLKIAWVLKTIMNVKSLDWACDLQYVLAWLSLFTNKERESWNVF